MFALLLLAGVLTAEAGAELDAEIQQAQQLLSEGRPAAAAQDFARLLDNSDLTGRERAIVVSNHGIALLQSGRREAAETSFAEANRLLSAWPAETFARAALANAEALAARQRGDTAAARRHHERAEALARGRHPELHGVSLANRAELERTQGDLREAEALARRAVTLIGTHPQHVAALHTLGLVLQTQGRAGEAVKAFEAVYETRQQTGGPAAATAAAALGSAYIAAGRYADAQRMLEPASEQLEQHLGPTHRDVAAISNNLAQLAKLTGDFAAADPLYRRALAIWQQTCGRDSREYALGLANFGDLHLAQGKGRGAAKLYAEAAQILAAVLPAGHPQLEQVLDRQREALAAGERQTSPHGLAYTKRLGAPKAR